MSDRRSSIARGGLLVGLLLALVLWLALAVPELAYAGHTYTNACPAADASCAALAERLEAVVAHLSAGSHLGDTAEQSRALLDSLNFYTEGHLDPDGDGTAAAYSSSSSGGTVALTADDRERLDLQWWGTWAIVGLLFIVIAAPRWFAAFRVNHGG